ncbi:PH domain-containing protein [Glaciibacter superstes]|uniref:PH domain-containing protein n=1 Tax=Glaciibacter superstes TaxID=501023 RepID=UPI0003B3FB51|nr:PH domain-containing protein [Glaciibacter superstes]
MSNSAGQSHDSPAVDQSAEQIVARVRPHARVLFWPTLLLFAVCGVTGYFLGRLPEQWQNIAIAVGAVVVIVLLWLLPLASWLNRRYTITTRRIIFRHGFFVRTRQELLHSRGYDVSLRRTWLQSAFRSGDVRINAGLEHPLVLKDVPNADLVQEVLHDLMESSQTVLGARRQEQSAQTDHSTLWTGH